MKERRKRKKKSSIDFDVDDSLKFANAAMGLAIGTQVLKGVSK